ncbi:MAG TPA: hypothetical protein VGG43_05865 [Acidimicrobiales bacterium]|jgi:hypothetical protein
MTRSPSVAGTDGAARAIRRLLCVAAGLVFLGAMVVFLFGVIVTAGVYGSRLAWLLGIVLPLLVLGALFARVAAITGASIGDGSAAGRVASNARLRRFSVICLAMATVPFALAAMLLFVYGVAFALYGVRIAAHWVIR